MRYRLTIPPAAEPVTLQQAKDHLRVDHEYEDALINTLITVARQQVEEKTRRQLVSATAELVLDRFPCGDGCVEIPVPPAVSVSSVTYVDTGGITQTVSAADYVLDAYSEPARLLPAYTKVWPATRGHVNDVTVTFLAGYITPLSADATANTFTATGRTFANGDRFELTVSGGDLPAGLSERTVYYVANASGGTFKLATTAGGTAVDFTDAGTGQLFAGRLPAFLTQAMLLLIGHLYENRAAVEVNQGYGSIEIPLAFDALLSSARWEVH